MRILALETSTDIGSVAILEDGVILAERIHAAPMRLLSWLSAAIRDILKDTGLDFSKIDAMATGIGPGSFTGVRLELATARTLSQVRKIPLYGISSLDALAYQTLTRQGTILSLIDARRGELFAGIYQASDSGFTQHGGYLCLSKEQLLTQVSPRQAPYHVIGGTNSDRSFFLEHLPDSQAAEADQGTVRASSTAILVSQRHQEMSGDLYSVSPLYIRKSSAEEERDSSYPKLSIQPLAKSDIPEIMEIEKTTLGWPQSAFVQEITQNRLASYFVARRKETLVGYAGVWLVLDEAHITTLAVHPDHRRQKVGEQLLQHLLTVVISKGARWATLEVRESNEAALELYKKYGFASVGMRKNYYQDDHENAVIMWAGNLRGESYKKKLTELKNRLGCQS